MPIEIEPVDESLAIYSPRLNKSDVSAYGNSLGNKGSDLETEANHLANGEIEHTVAHRRNVHFPSDDNLVGSICEGDEAWRIDPSIPNEEVIDRYVGACCMVEKKPLFSVIEQLSKVSIPFALHTFPAFIFKGIQLSSPDIEALEQIFKYCRFQHLSFENSNLDNNSLVVLLELIDYYACCTELCLARNRLFDSKSIKSIGAFLSKYPGLIWLDLRGIPILHTDAQALAYGIRSQYATARVSIQKYARRLSIESGTSSSVNSQNAKSPINLKEKTAPALYSSSELSSTSRSSEVSDFSITSSENKSVVSSLLDTQLSSPTKTIPLRDSSSSSSTYSDKRALACALSDQLVSSSLPADFKIIKHSTAEPAYLSEQEQRRLQDVISRFFSDGRNLTQSSFSAEQKVVLARIPPQCLRGLHLGETGICGSSLAELAAGIRIAGQLVDLRLPSNSLQASDMHCLTNLLRFHSVIEVLDLSCNNIGDEGCQVLCAALSTPSYASAEMFLFSNEPDPKPLCALKRLYLANNQIGEVGAKALADALPVCAHLTHLDLSGNAQLRCAGLHALQPGLLTSSCRQHLLYLGLANCRIACSGAIALAEVFADTPRALRRVNLTGNHISEAGLFALARSLTFCGEIICLDGLEGNRPLASAAVSVSSSSTVGVTSTQRFSLTQRILATYQPSCSPPTKDPSELSRQLLHQIHSQLALNLDARIAASSVSQSSRSTWAEVGVSAFCNSPRKTFRGYTRFPVIEADPRYLVGDSESESEDDGTGKI